MDAAFSPRVVGHRRPDYHCLEALLDSPQFRGRQGEDLVMAIYTHFTSQVDGTYHFWPSSEREGNPRIRRVNNDPIKIFNAYGWAICGQMAHILWQVYTSAGLKARTYGLPGHALCEVFYDGRWHHFDVDMWSWFRTPEGHIASAYELATNARALIFENRNKSNPCNLPDRSLEAYAEMYSKAETIDGRIKKITPDWGIRAHTMDFHLRPGETVLRTSENQGRFVMPHDWTQYRQKFEREWHGTPRERFAPFRTFGNGRWIYEPNLSSDYRDFEAGTWERHGLTQDRDGLKGEGSAVFRMQSPWPFAGIPNWQNIERITSSNGVWIEVAGRGACRVEVTDPEGEWSEVFCSEGAFDERMDITALLAARYDCLIRVTLGQGSRLNRFRFEGFFMIAPLTIPRLAEGENPMELRCADKHGQHTVPWVQILDLRPNADVAKQWVSAGNAKVEKRDEEGWQQIARQDESKPVQVVLRFDAPAGRRFGWAYLHTSHREGPENEPQRKALLEWSLDGKDWIPLSDRDICNTEMQWDCSLDGEVLLPDAAPAVWLRITSGTAIADVEFHGHLVVDDPLDGRLEITHIWKEGGVLKEFRAPVGEPTYSVTCGPEPTAHAVRMSRASVRP